jgi:hypothetical protein
MRPLHASFEDAETRPHSIKHDEWLGLSGMGTRQPSDALDSRSEMLPPPVPQPKSRRDNRSRSKSVLSETPPDLTEPISARSNSMGRNSMENGTPDAKRPLGRRPNSARQFTKSSSPVSGGVTSIEISSASGDVTASKIIKPRGHRRSRDKPNRMTQETWDAYMDGKSGNTLDAMKRRINTWDDIQTRGQRAKLQCWRAEADGQETWVHKKEQRGKVKKCAWCAMKGAANCSAMGWTPDQLGD